MLLLHHHRHEEKKTNATRLRDARTKRREKNFLRPQDRRAQKPVAGFIIRDRSDDAFGTTSEKKVPVYILLHHRSTSRSRRRTHSARACLLFLLLLFAIQKRKERPTSSDTQPVFCHPRSFRRRLRTDLNISRLSPSSLDVEKPKKNP